MPFRDTSVVHPLYRCVGEPIPMRKPPTGEPCAGEPHARFGGRGRPEPFPPPIGFSVVRMGVYRRKPFGAHPLLERLAFFQSLKLALPDLTDHYQSAIRTPEPFFFSELQRALADLRRIILDPNNVGPLGTIDVLNANIAPQDRFTDISRGAAEFSGPRFMAVLVGFALLALYTMRHVHLKPCMIF